MNYKNKLHIAFLDFDDIRNPLLNAGQARATLEVGRRLAIMGHKVTVYSCRYPSYNDRFERGITYKHIGLGTKHVRINNFFYILTVPFYVRKIKADVIVESFVAPISTLCTPLFTKVPVIGLPSMFNAKAFARKYHLPFHWIEALGSRTYKYFLPYSDIDRKKMVSLNPSIIYKIVPQGVDYEYFRIKHKTPKHILFLSRLDIEQKGIDLLLHAYVKAGKLLKYPLVLAGHGPDDQKIKALIKDLKLEKKVHMVGSAYGKTKKRLLSEAIFVAFPSRHDELSLWALEALASGMPIVAFDLPEASWIPKSASMKAKLFDTDEYSRLLVRATDKALNRQMRINARKIARPYTWNKVAKMFNAFIQEVVKIERSNK